MKIAENYLVYQLIFPLSAGVLIKLFKVNNSIFEVHYMLIKILYLQSYSSIIYLSISEIFSLFGYRIINKISFLISFCHISCFVLVNIQNKKR